MCEAGDSWDDDGDHTESGIVNDPLREKTPTKVRWHRYPRAARYAFFVSVWSDIYASDGQ
jgi:hypothetical protein